MSTLLQVIFFSLIGGLVSLIGGFALLASKKHATKLVAYVTPFAAGALLAAAFMDLLREAAHEGAIDQALVFTLIGILTFFLLERSLRWFHHHHEHADHKADPTASLIIIGDTLHNFIDGIAIAAGFLLSPQTGIVVTLAVAAHEIPQEIGDFGLLLQKGLRRKTVVIANIVSALATTVSAAIFFTVGQSFTLPLGAILGLIAGFFIYIAVSDIIPEIHKTKSKTLANWQSAMLIIGAVLVSVVTLQLHGYIDQSHEHSEHTQEQIHHDEHEADHHDH